MHFRSTADLAATIARNLHRIPQDVDLVAGVPRSGLLAANLIALDLNLPFTHVDGLFGNEVFRRGMTRSVRGDLSSPQNAKHVLIVDDSVLSGKTIKEIAERINRAAPPYKVTYLAIYVTQNSAKLVDMHFEVCPTPRMFGWNYLHHPLLDECCVDIDGVVCRDPTDRENDDGSGYLKFLVEVTAHRVPTHEVGWFVTSRLEKYRPQTEAWLARHGFRYRHLVMLEGHDAESRRRLGVHGTFKASVYRQVPASLFIESNPIQAAEIARLSGKPVLCAETQALIEPALPATDRLTQIPSNVEIYARRFIKRAKRKLANLRPSH